MSLTGMFLEMVTGLGRARELGLSEADCILIRRCSCCNTTAEHLSHEHHNPDGRVWEFLICLNCRHETDVCVR